MAKATLTSTENGADSMAAINANFTELYDVVTPASASTAAAVVLREDTDNGTNKVTLIAPSSIASDATLTLPGTTDTLVGRDTTDTLTNKTLTTPVVNGAVTGTITPPLTFYSTIPLSEGQIVNGKISVTVSSNNLTLALKGWDGNDPSASNPVYCRIGGTIRSVTAALSVTKNAGTNWCNAGAAELATKEIDYFAYLGYNATDGVVIGFSRYPGATQYGDFSTTTTNEKYCAISTITTAASTDYYDIIGRFAATLSAGAGYTWSVPTFTAINLIQKPIYETRWLTWLPTYTGFSSAPTALPAYKVSGDLVHAIVGLQGTSNSATFNFTLPWNALAATTGQSQNRAVKIVDNSAHPTNAGLLGITIAGANDNVAKVGVNLSTAAANAYAGFTTSNAKGIEDEFFFKI